MYDTMRDSSYGHREDNAGDGMSYDRWSDYGRERRSHSRDQYRGDTGDGVRYNRRPDYGRESRELSMDRYRNESRDRERYYSNNYNYDYGNDYRNYYGYDYGYKYGNDEGYKHGNDAVYKYGNDAGYKYSNDKSYNERRGGFRGHTEDVKREYDPESHNSRRELRGYTGDVKREYDLKSFSEKYWKETMTKKRAEASKNRGRQYSSVHRDNYVYVEGYDSSYDNEGNDNWRDHLEDNSRDRERARWPQGYQQKYTEEQIQKKQAEDPYWYPGKGKNSRPTNMPTQNPHDPRPRNPKRTHSCRNEHPNGRHARLERKHALREKERENIAKGIAVPPPNAGPNWAEKREATLAKYAKNTKRRSKRHQKRMRDAAAGSV